jgi:26S proteasome regulatory subunit N2
MALGFVMLRVPDQLPPLVSLLADSYNPHVRYGACMALGVACAGTAHRAALDVVLPMLEDNEAFVRQGAMMAASLILMQENEARCKEVKTIREKITSALFFYRFFFFPYLFLLFIA